MELEEWIGPKTNQRSYHLLRTTGDTETVFSCTIPEGFNKELRWAETLLLPVLLFWLLLFFSTYCTGGTGGMESFLYALDTLKLRQISKTELHSISPKLCHFMLMDNLYYLCHPLLLRSVLDLLF